MALPPPCSPPTALWSSNLSTAFSPLCDPLYGALLDAPPPILSSEPPAWTFFPPKLAQGVAGGKAKEEAPLTKHQGAPPHRLCVPAEMHPLGNVSLINPCPVASMRPLDP